MATKRLMIQVYVEQVAAGHVSDVTILSQDVGIFLDPRKKAVVREIATEEMGGIIANGTDWVPIGLTSRAYAELKLIYPVKEGSETFYAPSHVESPEMVDYGGAILTVMEIGVGSTGNNLVVGRGIAAHAYIDQID